MLINNINQEERDDHLTFIRLSPQSAWSILGGKLIGVPILLYIFILFVIPINLLSGSFAQVNLLGIFAFYLVTAISCFFFYSAALLFGLANIWLGKFSSWIGSFIVFYFQSIIILMSDGSENRNYAVNNFASDWLNLFCPSTILNYLIANSNPDVGYFTEFSQEFQWFDFSLNTVTFTILTLVNYILLTFFIWQAIKRRFRNKNSTLLSKKSSYLLTITFHIFIVGFIWQEKAGNFSDSDNTLANSFITFFLISLLYYLGLIAALLPKRQSILDWYRSRKLEMSSQITLFQDLAFGKKSPPLLAIFINLAIAGTILMIAAILVPCIVLNIPWNQLGEYYSYQDYNYVNDQKEHYLVFFLEELIMGFISYGNLILICAVTIQFFSFIKIKAKTVWIIVSGFLSLVLPGIILGIFAGIIALINWLNIIQLSPSFLENLFSEFSPISLVIITFPWAVHPELLANTEGLSFRGAVILALFLCLVEWIILGLLILLFRWRLRKASQQDISVS